MESTDAIDLFKEFIENDYEVDLLERARKGRPRMVFDFNKVASYSAISFISLPILCIPLYEVIAIISIPIIIIDKALIIFVVSFIFLNILTLYFIFLIILSDI